MDLISLQGLDYHASSFGSSIQRSVYINTPLSFLLCPLAVSEGEFGDKVNQYLPLHSRSRTVLYVKLTELHCPQSHSSCCLWTTQSFSQGLVCQDNDSMCLEVRFEISRCDYQHESQLLHLRVPLFCPSKRSARKVDWSLRSVFLFYQSCAYSGV